MQEKVASCRAAWDRKDFAHLQDSVEALRQLHDRWFAAFKSFRSLVTAPYKDATPFERIKYQADYVAWLASEIEAWRSLFPTIRRFAKQKQPKTILRVQKLLRSVSDLHAALENLAKTANLPLDLQIMEYLKYRPPKPVKKA